MERSYCSCCWGGRQKTFDTEDSSSASSCFVLLSPVDSLATATASLAFTDLAPSSSSSTNDTSFQAIPIASSSSSSGSADSSSMSSSSGSTSSDSSSIGSGSISADSSSSASAFSTTSTISSVHSAALPVILPMSESQSTSSPSPSHTDAMLASSLLAATSSSSSSLASSSSSMAPSTFSSSPFSQSMSPVLSASESSPSPQHLSTFRSAMPKSSTEDDGDLFRRLQISFTEEDFSPTKGGPSRRTSTDLNKKNESGSLSVPRRERSGSSSQENSPTPTAESPQNSPKNSPRNSTRSSSSASSIRSSASLSTGDASTPPPPSRRSPGSTVRRLPHSSIPTHSQSDITSSRFLSDMDRKTRQHSHPQQTAHLHDTRHHIPEDSSGPISPQTKIDLLLFIEQEIEVLEQDEINAKTHTSAIDEIGNRLKSAKTELTDYSRAKRRSSAKPGGSPIPGPSRASPSAHSKNSSRAKPKESAPAPTTNPPDLISKDTKIALIKILNQMKVFLERAELESVIVAYKTTLNAFYEIIQTADSEKRLFWDYIGS